MRCRLLQGLLILSLGLHPAAVTATIINVPAEQDSIQGGIVAAAGGDTVLVAPGVYKEAIDFIGKDIVIVSSGGPDVTFIEPGPPGENLVQMISGESNAAEFTGFTVRNSGDVAAIYVAGAEPDIHHNVFLNNYLSASYYGAVRFAANANPEFHHNLLIGNGGIASIFIGNSIHPHVYNNTIAFGLGTGIDVHSASVVIRNNVIYRCGYSGIRSFAGEIDSDYNCVFDNSTNFRFAIERGDHDIIVYPQFTDTTAQDYSLLVTSPCVDLGDPDPVYTDADGTRADVGAYPLLVQVQPFPAELTIGSTFPQQPVINPSPGIQWLYTDTNGGMQQAYEIEVGTDPDWSVAELWATGQVTSTTESVAYGGAAFDDHTTYYLRARLHDGTTWGDWRGVTFVIRLSTAVYVPDDYATIQAAIDAAITDDTIWVIPGTYSGEGNRDIEMRGKRVVVAATHGPDSTTIDCGGTEVDHHIAFLFQGGEDTTSIVEGFTITGAVTDSGAISFASGFPVIRNCVIDGTDGNGIWSQYDFSSRIESCVVKNSTGHGMIFENCQSIVTDCQVLDNCGSGIQMLWGGYMRVTGSIIARNEAEGIFVYTMGPPFEIEDCTIVENRDGIVWWANFPRPGLDPMLLPTDIQWDSVFVLNSIVAFNDSDGVSLEQYFDIAHRISCCDVYENGRNDFVGTDHTGGDAFGNISVDPQFCPAMFPTYDLSAGSVCLPANNSCNLQIGARGEGCLALPCCGFFTGGYSGNVDRSSDGVVDLGDILYHASVVFFGAPNLCPADGNTDGDPACVSDLGDILWTANAVFLGGPACAACDPDCE